MVFRKMMGALGVGGPSVATELSNPNTRPGLALDGVVHLRGGSNPADIDQVTLSLVTRVEIEGGDTEYAGMVEFHRLPVAGATHLAPGQELSVPFRFPVPWETPVTDLYGQHLHGMTMGLRTDVSVARAVDRSDLDPVAVHPLPVQERILEAFGRLGFRFKGADLERGHIAGVRQRLPFYQEIEFYAPPQYGVNEVELTFVTDEYGLDVVLECDKRGGLFTEGHDAYGRYPVTHADADRVDWAGQVDGWLRQTVQAHGAHGFHGGHGGHGSGVGGMLAGGALGFAGGLVAGELVEEAVEAFTDDESFDSFDFDEE
jgi:sporulation-control protein